jgi:hypothetical protein
MTSVVQSGNNQIALTSTATTSGTFAFGSNVTAGNYGVVVWTFRDTANAAIGAYTPSVSDTLSSSWSDAASSAFFIVNRNAVMFIHIAQFGSSGANTISVSSAGVTSCRGGALFCFEVSGLTSTTPESTGNNGNTDIDSAIQHAAVSSALTWSSAQPFIVAVMHGYENAATALGIGASENVNTTAAQNEVANDSFGTLYAIGSAANGYTSGSEDLYYNWNCATNSEGMASVAAAFPGAAPASGSKQTAVNL